jgi:hypothetical protein
MAIHVRDGQDNELLTTRRLKELQIAFETGARKWAKNRDSIADDSILISLACVLLIPVTYVCAQGTLLIFDSKSLGKFLPMGCALIPAFFATLFILTGQEIKKKRQREQAEIYKPELELFRINVELEHQHVKSALTEELLNKIDQALEELAKI